jgi:hypothetical protein
MYLNIARDKDGSLVGAVSNLQRNYASYECWLSENGVADMIDLPREWFPTLKWPDEPIKVELQVVANFEQQKLFEV